MKHFRLIIAAAAIFAITGCAQLENAYSVVTGSSVSPGAVIVAGYSVDALEATATQYLRRPRCGTSSTIICRSPAATKAIIPAVRSMRVARDAAEQFLATHPGQLGSQGLYDALQSSAGALKAILEQYAISIGG